MVLACPPCQTTCDDFFCAYECYHAVDVTQCNGDPAVNVPRAAFSRLSSSVLSIPCSPFTGKSIDWKLSFAEYPDTNSPPGSITDPDGNVWTVVESRQSTAFCYWRCRSKCLAIENNFGKIQVGTKAFGRSASGSQTMALTWADVPGVMRIRGGFRTVEDNQHQAITQAEVQLDPATFPADSDWTGFLFRESATATKVYRYESSNEPVLGEPLVMDAEEFRG